MKKLISALITLSLLTACMVGTPAVVTPTPEQIQGVSREEYVFYAGAASMCLQEYHDIQKCIEKNRAMKENHAYENFIEELENSTPGPQG